MFAHLTLSLACAQVTDHAITVSGRAFPIELFLEQGDFTKENGMLVFLPTETSSIQDGIAYMQSVASTWGWQVVMA